MKLFNVFVIVFALLLTTAAQAQFPKVNPEELKKIEAALPKEAPAKPKKSRKLLIFSKTNGFRHSSIATGAASITLLGKKTGAWEAFHTEDDSYFEADKLKQFDAVIMINTTGEIFRPSNNELKKLSKEQQAIALKREEVLKKNLVDFVKSGKGLAGTHSATDTYKNWKEYNDMMGGAFVSHPWHAKVPVQNLNPKHPLNRVFNGKGFEITDEIYQFRNDTAKKGERKYLLALQDGWDGLKRGKRDNNFWPISWVDKYGEGRVFYCSLGHRNEIYYNPAVLEHYLSGIQYALGDLEADATP